MYALGEQDAAGLWAAHLDAFGPRCWSQGIQDPLGRSGLVEGPQLSDGLPP